METPRRGHTLHVFPLRLWLPLLAQLQTLDVCWMSNKNERLPQENPPMSDNGVSGTFLHGSVLVRSPCRAPSIILDSDKAVAPKTHHMSFSGVAYYPGGDQRNYRKASRWFGTLFKEFPHPRESGLIIKVGPGMQGVSRNFSGECHVLPGRELLGSREK